MPRMHEHWSIGLGRWGGVELRLHVSLLLAFVLLLYTASRESDEPLLGMVAGSAIGLWLFSLLLHETVQQMARRHHGTVSELIVLGPCGDLVRDPTKGHGSGELVAMLAGGMTSLALGLISYAFVRWTGSVSLSTLMQPDSLSGFLPESSNHQGVWTTTIPRLLLTINAWMVLLNLLPTYPFDIGWALVTLLQQLRPDWDRRRAGMWVAIGSRAIAVIFLLLALILHSATPRSVLPTWLVLSLLSLTILFASRGVEQGFRDVDDEEEDPDDDFSRLARQGERRGREIPSRPWFFTRFVRAYLRRRRVRQARIEADEDRQLDAILARLHAGGMQSLTPPERALLRRASARYKNRQSSV